MTFSGRMKSRKKTPPTMYDPLALTANRYGAQGSWKILAVVFPTAAS
jgi:hypothetical protein